MLRINPDGTIPTDNPFYSNASGKNKAIWALGLRNPFSFAVQPDTDRMFINDVGARTWEEVNIGIKGANYGWPVYEGPETDPEYTSPLFAYQHGRPPPRAARSRVARSTTPRGSGSRPPMSATISSQISAAVG